LPELVPEREARAGAILLFDGIFLHRPELAGYWDYSIFLDVNVATCLARCAARGDGVADPHAESNRRYVLGFQRYVRECDPKAKATIVLDNENLANPFIKE
jgi:uridine kinase